MPGSRTTSPVNKHALGFSAKPYTHWRSSALSCVSRPALTHHHYLHLCINCLYIQAMLVSLSLAVALRHLSLGLLCLLPCADQPLLEGEQLRHEPFVRLCPWVVLPQCHKRFVYSERAALWVATALLDQVGQHDARGPRLACTGSACSQE